MISQNVKEIMAELGNVKLVAVTKTRSAEEIMEAIAAGVRIIAENRVQEAAGKYPKLSSLLKEKGAEFHMIGHLQKNKAKKAVGLFDVIQSVDSLELAQELDSQAGEIGKVQKIMVQVNIGDEDQKSGVGYDEAEALVKSIKAMKNLSVTGIMCIPPFSVEQEMVRPYFRKMKELFDRVKDDKIRYLSMGMSNDYKVSIQEGSNMVRLGTILFGESR
jgi:PLP dependent protein